MQPPINLPPPIRTDGSNPFAYNTMRYRQPRMIDDIIRANPDYSKGIIDDLTLLKYDMVQNNPIMLLNLFPVFTPDYMSWAQALIDRGGLGNQANRASWLNTDWFFAETVMFRLIIEAVRWWETERDPYAPMKAKEMNSDALWHMLNVALSLEGGVYDRLPTLIQLATWGNRMDLGYLAVANIGAQASNDDLLVDDSITVRDFLLQAQLKSFPDSAQGMTHIIVDNAGTELVMDLALVDALLTGFSDMVILHVKQHPTFVSDATPADVRQTIQRMIDGPHASDNPMNAKIAALGERLQTAFHAGRLRLSPNLFWNSSDYLWEMPQALERLFDEAQLVILKGDANYRRSVGDAMWYPETPFAEVTSYFDYPLLALRTLKSDPIIGLQEGRAEQLDLLDGEWRVNGKRAVIQFRP